jgi:DNA polymerase-3 subunit epsilon
MKVSHHRSESEALLPWPLAVIDFEASSLAPGSYPIEVGVAVWDSPEAPLRVWSTLIRPHVSWSDRPWSAQSEEVHGISRRELDAGMPVQEAMAAANAVVSGHSAWCDGGTHDLTWLTELENASGIASTFTLRDWDALGGVLHPRRYRRMIRWLGRSRAPHRAGPDAQRLLRAVAVSLHRTYGTSRRIETA